MSKCKSNHRKFIGDVCTDCKRSQYQLLSERLDIVEEGQAAHVRAMEEQIAYWMGVTEIYVKVGGIDGIRTSQD